jgi:hypothetical protein
MDNRRQGIKEDITSYPTFRDWRDQNASYAYMAGVTEAAFTLTGANEPERLDGARVARRRSIRNDDAGAIEGSLHGVAPADPVTQAWRSCS